MAAQNDVAFIDERVHRGSRSSIQGFVQDIETQKADSQLVHCLQGNIKEESLQLKGQLINFYEDDEIPPVPDSPDIEEQYKLLDAQYTEFLQHLKNEVGSEEGKGKTQEKRWGRLNIIRKRGKKDQKALAKQDTKEIKKESETWELESQKSSSTTIEDVKEVVLHAQEHWKTKNGMLSGKAQIYFHKFCGMLNDHLGLLSILPEQDRYFSIFCGGVKALIKASVNHCKIADDLASSLYRISADIDLCAATLKVWPMNDIKVAVGQLYSYIFHFLGCAMKWYQSKSWKKVLDALNENFLGSFESTLSDIESLKTWIHQTTTLKSQAALKDMHNLLRDNARRASEARAAVRRMWYSIDARADERFLQLSRQIGSLIRTSLESNFQAYTQPEGHAVVRRPILAESSTQKHNFKQKSLSTKRTYTRNTLQRWSRHLESYMMPITDLMDTRNSSADSLIVTALENWSQSVTSGALWIRDYKRHTYPSYTTRIAATVATRALQVGLPLLGFFCDYRDSREDPENDVFLSLEDNEACQTSVMINFAYTLIRQVVNLLPNEIKTRSKFSKSAFAKLDGTLTSWDDAIKILKKLIRLTPQAIVVVIDGLEMLDDPDMEEYVDDILTLLLGQDNSMESDSTRVFKILFTTAGACPALEKFDNLKMVSPIQVRAKRLRGRGRRLLELAF